MAKARAPSPLEDLDLSADEVQRLTSAFQDAEFRRLFSEYAAELTDPENRRRYEAEVTALERERGVEVRFVHPEPDHALRTSLDGVRRCFVNVCGNALVGAPRSQPGPEGAAPGRLWSLPHSLAPGREYAGRRGGRYTVYDVVFHPAALALARRCTRFRQMLDATALGAVEKQFGVTLDRTNAKVLKAKYKGSPEAAVLRTPLPGGAPTRPDREPEGLLPDFPYPYPAPAAPGSAAAPRPQTRPAPEEAPRPGPTEPRCSVVQRHHVDLQDYRCSRDSAPSPVPRELVVTIELPLLRSAEQAALEVAGKLLSLDSRRPDYRLRLPLPYAVDESRGTARFHTARRQLVVTLPVVRPPARWGPAAAREEAACAPGTDGTACASAGAGEAGPAKGCAGRAGTGAGEAAAAGAAEEQDSGGRAGSALGAGEEPPPAAGGAGGGGRGDSSRPSRAGVGPGSSAATAGERGAVRAEARVDPEGTGREPSAGATASPGTQRGAPLRPPLQCRQDEGSLTLLIPVPGIQADSLRGEVSPRRYRLGFSTQAGADYSFFLQFAPENKLSVREPVISISSNNAVIELSKSPESPGIWREWYYGLNKDSLEEKLFVNEENVNEFVDEVLSPPFRQTSPLTPPLIEVLQVTDNKIQIHAKMQDSNYAKLHEKEERINERSHLNEKENREHLTTTTTDIVQAHAMGSAGLSDSSVIRETDSCSPVACLQQGSLDVSQVLFEKSQQPKSQVKPEFIKEESGVYSNEEKQNLKEPVKTEETELDDPLSPLLNKTEVHNLSAFEGIKETSMQDGSVQIINDHVTHCAFSFQNSLLYDLD
ncbi:protein kintoun [Tamandua tetradactyla]|uniref:protein kintoun n=1 Tax=Tamandua tetradactyla TaxID=48850 RepID=UPI004053C5A9